MKQIATALLKAQKQMGNAIKGSANPFFKSRYADLNAIREACMPALNDNGIVVLQPTVVMDGKNYVKTLLLHESGESLECLTEILYKNVGDAQGQGSGISYARRYGLQSFVNIGADDDDGNHASALTKEQVKPNDNKFLELSDKVKKCNSLDELKLLHDVSGQLTQAELALFTKRKSELNG